jgi:hypothetical protein
MSVNLRAPNFILGYLSRLCGRLRYVASLLVPRPTIVHKREAIGDRPAMRRF